MSKYREVFEQLNEYKDNEQYLDEFIKLIRNILYERDSFVKNSNNDSLRDEFFISLREAFNYIFKDKNISGNIEYIGSGHTSLAFKIGDNVIKISKKGSINPRKIEHNSLIPVLMNKDFKVDQREIYTIQISPYVDSSSISEEELYGVYKRLREYGYIWNDPTFENVGRIRNDLETDNISYKKGDLVILDLEDLAYVGEDTSDDILEEIAISSYNSRTYRYETRYLKEKGKVL